jgi:hypothetical protein
MTNSQVHGGYSTARLINGIPDTTDRDRKAALTLATYALDQTDPAGFLADILDALGLRPAPTTDTPSRRQPTTRRPHNRALAPITHGEPRGYQAHLKRGETACPECVTAHNTSKRQGAKRRRAAK